MKMEKNEIPILQTVCSECKKEIYRKKSEDDYLYCIECGAKLPQQSSEDADDGRFEENK
jgi:predicted nucleic acid-binding Zn ribbon protein